MIYIKKISIIHDHNYHLNATLEERRREIDMVETYKILPGISDVEWKRWFTKKVTADGGRVTRLAADHLNLTAGPARLELRKTFYSQSD